MRSLSEDQNAKRLVVLRAACVLELVDVAFSLFYHSQYSAETAPPHDQSTTTTTAVSLDFFTRAVGHMPRARLAQRSWCLKCADARSVSPRVQSYCSRGVEGRASGRARPAQRCTRRSSMAKVPSLAGQSSPSPPPDMGAFGSRLLHTLWRGPGATALALGG